MKVIRKDGIEYERKPKTRNYNSVVNIRLSTEMIENLKEIASKKGIKYNTMVRNILEEFILKEL